MISRLLMMLIFGLWVKLRPTYLQRFLTQRPIDWHKSNTHIATKWRSNVVFGCHGSP